MTEQTINIKVTPVPVVELRTIPSDLIQMGVSAPPVNLEVEPIAVVILHTIPSDLMSMGVSAPPVKLAIAPPANVGVTTIGVQGPPGVSTNDDDSKWSYLLVTDETYTVLVEQPFVEFDCTSQSQFILLPESTTCLGDVFKLNRIAGGDNLVVISAQEGQYINSDVDWTLYDQWESLELTAVPNGYRIT
jgi:hypothetical protein